MMRNLSGFIPHIYLAQRIQATTSCFCFVFSHIYLVTNWRNPKIFISTFRNWPWNVIHIRNGTTVSWPPPKCMSWICVDSIHTQAGKCVNGRHLQVDSRGHQHQSSRTRIGDPWTTPSDAQSAFQSHSRTHSHPLWEAVATQGAARSTFNPFVHPLQADNTTLEYFVGKKKASSTTNTDMFFLSGWPVA